MLDVIVWDIDPVIFELGKLKPRWYGLMWALGFIIGYYVVRRMLRNEGVGDKWMDKLLLYCMAGGVLGARLGHVFFYGPYWDGIDAHGNAVEGYLDHPIKILQLWEGGLASHGGALGILIALWLYQRWVTKRSYFWALDRVVVAVPLAGALIRMGNLFNHEIAGKVTDVSWAFSFTRYQHPLTHQLDATPRHPTQLYEAIAYALIFAIMLWLYWRKDAGRMKGFLFGMFMTLVFSVRILVEFIKENQAAVDEEYLLNMGQILSLPLVAAGIGFMIWSWRKGKIEGYPPAPPPEAQYVPEEE